MNSNNKEIILNILEILYDFNITEDDLIKSEIGKTIMEIYNNCNSNIIKEKARDLINKWSKKIFKTDFGYRDT